MTSQRGLVSDWLAATAGEVWYHSCNRVREYAAGRPARRLPAGWQTTLGQWRRPVMSRRSLRKLLFTSGPKLLTLGQILLHYAERAFHELSYVCFGFILAIMGIALDRSKWRSVISPKIAIIFLCLTPFDLENIDPRTPKLLTLKFTGVPIHLPSLVTLALIEAEIAGRDRICPPPLSKAR